MNKYILLVSGFIIMNFLSVYCQTNLKIDKKIKNINLNYVEDKPYLAYENYVSIIYIEKSLIINNLKTHLKNKKLCDLRRKKYTIILNQLSKNDSSFYIIEPTMAPEMIKQLGININTDKNTGYFPVDYYASLFKLDISKNYIPPYGYNIELDTINKVSLKMYYSWMMSELILEGKAKIYNKFTKEYEKEVKYEIVRFEGHGGEQLQFTDNTLFFIVKTYSDNIRPDRECGNDYEGYEKIE